MIDGEHDEAAMTDWTDAAAPSLDDLAALARAAFDALPAAVRAATGEVVFRIDDFASDEVLAELGIEDPFELSGLYQGIDRIHRSVLDPSPEVSRVFLYRRPILDEWAERGDVTLGDLVAHVLIHEIGHHMGLSDADIETIEAGDA
ncbi:MAG: metallopeptidase family protein [Caulobacteraceae bacterium]